MHSAAYHWDCPFPPHYYPLHVTRCYTVLLSGLVTHDLVISDLIQVPYLITKTCILGFGMDL